MARELGWDTRPPMGCYLAANRQKIPLPPRPVIHGDFPEIQHWLTDYSQKEKQEGRTSTRFLQTFCSKGSERIWNDRRHRIVSVESKIAAERNIWRQPMSEYTVKISWNGRIYRVTVTARGSDFARKYVRDLHPGCSIILVHRVGPA